MATWHLFLLLKQSIQNRSNRLLFLKIKPFLFLFHITDNGEDDSDEEDDSTKKDTKTNTEPPKKRKKP